MSEASNQSAPFIGFNPYSGDPVLKLATSSLSSQLRSGLETYATGVVTAQAYDLARLANENPPVLKTHDAKGHRIDEVEFHPSYNVMMRRSITAGLHCSIWDDGALEKGLRNLARAARFMMTAGTESGHLCPLTMTNASVATLTTTPSVFSQWLPLIRSRNYDGSQRPVNLKASATIGMGLTEKQGGTDVRANVSKAEPLDNGLWRLTGHKWFMSAPMSDAFLITAQASGQRSDQQGLSCYLVPRILPDGSDNGLRFQRLKAKLGNRSNASSEVEFDGSLGFLIGEAGRGINAIIEMITLTRLDCALSAAGLMRASLSEAVHHCTQRYVMGKQLSEQPLMQRVLADMALDVAGATALVMRLARAFDQAGSNPQENAYARVMTPVVKYWVCKTAPSLIYEAMECLGGNGYVEEGNLARAYREAPVNAIWEGSGNVMALDLMRVLSRSPDSVDSVFAMIGNGLAPQMKSSMDVLKAAASVSSGDEGSARIFIEQLALTAAASELEQIVGGEMADAFGEGRLARPWRATYGMLGNRFDPGGILRFAYPDHF